MKLLFDQNICFRIISKIIINFPDSKQIRELGIEDYADNAIWSYAKENDFTIVTFDSDFFDISNLRGHPPKIIWLRFGNTTTNFLAEIINSKTSVIKDFIDKLEYEGIACLEIK